MLSKSKVLIVLLIVSFMAMVVSGFFIYKAFAGKATVEQEEKMGPLYEPQEFTVNACESVNHYIKLQFAVELSDEEVLKELERKSVLLHDAVIMVLSQQSAEVLTVAGKEKLKTDLITAINSFLNDGTIKNLYFKTLLFS